MTGALPSAGLGNYNGSLNVILDVHGPRFALLGSTSMGDVSVALSWKTPEGETLAATPLVFQVDAPYTQAPYSDSPVSVPTVCGPNNSIGGYSVVYSFSAVSFFQNPLTSMPVNERSLPFDSQ
jgi:hypothetical protein